MVIVGMTHNIFSNKLIVLLILFHILNTVLDRAKVNYIEPKVTLTAGPMVTSTNVSNVTPVSEGTMPSVTGVTLDSFVRVTFDPVDRFSLPTVIKVT